MLPDEAGLRLCAQARSTRSLWVGGRARTPPTLRASCVALTVETVCAGAHPIQEALVDVWDDVQHPPWRLDLSPGALPRLCGERRASGHDHWGAEPAIFAGWSKRVHAVLSIALDPLARYRTGSQGSGGPQQRATAGRDFIKAQAPRTGGAHALPVGLQVARRIGPQTAGMERAP